MRTRYQRGSVARRERRGGDVWVYRYYDGRTRRAEIIGTVQQYPTKSKAERAAEHLRVNANPDKIGQVPVTFGAVIQQYVREELPERKSTRKGYLPWINKYIRPQWAEHDLREMSRFPIAIENWLKTLDLQPKSRGNIRSVMSIMFECAMRWGYVELPSNPMERVRVRGISKRQAEPRILSADEIRALYKHLREPHLAMVMVATCLGLRVSEILGLQWDDFDWLGSAVTVQRGIVLGTCDKTKTIHSTKRLPLDERLAQGIQEYKKQWHFCEWVFANPDTKKPWWPHQVLKHVRRAAVKAEIKGYIGWHTFRHTYSSILRDKGVDIKVQQELLRHADPNTTLRVYTQPVGDSLRLANQQVVSELLQ